MAIPRLNVGDKFTASNQNAIADAINNVIEGYTSSGIAVALATLAGWYATPAVISFTLAVQTRVKIRTLVEVDVSAGAPMQARMNVAYNPGAAPDNTGAGGTNGATVTRVGYGFPHVHNSAALNDYQDAEYPLVLAAGTWCVFGSLQRVSGGSAADQIIGSVVFADAIGFT